MRQKRILLLIPNLGPGGAQKVFRDQLSVLGEDNQVWGCVFNHDFSFVSDRTYISLDVPAGKNFFQKVYYFLLRVLRLRKIKSSLQIDICISHLEGADYVNVLARSSGKTFCWIHGTKKFDQMIGGPLGWIRKKVLIPFLYRKADLLITVSASIKRELVDNFGIKQNDVRVCFNGIDIDQIKSSFNDELPSAFELIVRDFPVLITHCRFAPQKNVIAMIEIFHRLKKESNGKLVLLGDGDLRTLIVSACDRLGLKTGGIWANDENIHTTTGDVYFYGYQSNPYKFLNRATLYISTSLWEGYPLALCEALACGLPVIASDCYTGPREILAPADLLRDKPVDHPVSSEVGVLMPLPNSDNAYDVWAATIANVIRDSDWRLSRSKAARLRADDFDLATVGTAWKKVVMENE